MKNSLLIPILASGTLCAATAGYSAEETTNLSVTAVVADFCAVAAGTAMDFSTFDTTQGVDENTPGSITVVCSSSKTGISVTIGAGANASGGQRNMVDTSSNLLPYDVHKDAAHNNEIAIDGEIYAGNVSAAVPLVLPVYGQVPAGNYAAGTYSDTVTVTLTYP